MRWLVEFYNERRGILARYGVEAPLPAAAILLGRNPLFAEYPPAQARRRLSLSSDGMFTFLFKRRKREQGPPLNETQRALVAKKFEILRQASFGFTQDRLFHILEEDVKGWTDACTGDLRRKIASAAPLHNKIALIDFRKLRCVSLQCLPSGLLPAPVYS